MPLTLTTITTKFATWQYRDDNMKRQRLAIEGHPWQPWHVATPCEMALVRKVKDLEADLLRMEMECRE